MPLLYSRCCDYCLETGKKEKFSGQAITVRSRGMSVPDDHLPIMDSSGKHIFALSLFAFFAFFFFFFFCRSVTTLTMELCEAVLLSSYWYRNLHAQTSP